MCYGRCAKSIGYTLLVLSVLCIVANVLLYFPNGESRYASHYPLGNYVGCLHGIIGGGLLVLISACVFIGLEHDHFHGCCPQENCRRSCAMLAIVILGCVGILGAGYCFIISALALARGPCCYCEDDRVLWATETTWASKPRSTVTWNVTLFSILLVLSAVELILCIVQVVYGCLGGACASCHGHKEVRVCSKVSWGLFYHNKTAHNALQTDSASKVWLLCLCHLEVCTCAVY
uniref:Transmembrane 4 L six family member 1 n=1 Tax=Varanus komodoensis TaxID=61221 RepID=A0A8D2LPB7_VARKO